MSVGNNIQTIRKEKNLTQAELAKKMDISRSYLSDLENNRKNPSTKTLRSLSEKLNVTMLYLTTGKKAVSDLTDNEKNEAFEGVKTSLKKQSDKMQNKLKEDMEKIINSELTYTQTLYLTNALSYLKLSSDDDIRFLSSIIINLTRYNDAKLADNVTQKELLKFIEGETKSFEEFLKQRYGYKDGD